MTDGNKLLSDQQSNFSWTDKRGIHDKIGVYTARPLT